MNRFMCYTNRCALLILLLFVVSDAAAAAAEKDRRPDSKYFPIGALGSKGSPFSKISFGLDGRLYLAHTRAEYKTGKREELTVLDTQLRIATRSSSLLSTPSITGDNRGRIYVIHKNMVIRRGGDFSGGAHQFPNWMPEVNPGHEIMFFMNQVYYNGLGRFDGNIVIGLDAGEHIYIGTDQSKDVIKFNRDGGRVGVIAAGPCLQLAVSANGRLAVVRKAGMIQIYDGKLTERNKNGGVLIESVVVSTLKAVVDQVAFGPGNHLYVLDRKAGRIARYTERGKPAPFTDEAPYIDGHILGGTEAEAPGTFNAPYMAVAPDGRIAVLDGPASRRVQLFAPGGRYSYDPFTIGALKPGAEHHLFPPDKPVTYTLPITNRAPVALTLSLTGTWKDLHGVKTPVETMELEVEANSTSEVTISLEPTHRGHYTVNVQLAVGDWQRSASARFAVIEPVKKRRRPNSAFHFDSRVGGRSTSIAPDWGTLEPKRGEFDFAKTDKTITDHRDGGTLSIYYACVWYVPNWMVTDPDYIRDFGMYGYLYGWSNIPDDFRLYANYAARMVERWKDDVPRWNMWNEPEYFWGGTPLEYTQMVKTAFIDMKLADPTAQVMLAAPTGNGELLRKHYAAAPDLKHYFDTVTAHYISINTPESMLDILGKYRAIMAEYGDTLKPIVNTEEGTAGPLGTGVASEFAQIQAFVNAYVIGASEGIEATMWFHGVMPGNQPLPVAVAANTVVSQIEDAVPIAAPEVGEGIYDYAFVRGNRRIDVVWTQTEKKTVVLKRKGRVTITDIEGNAHREKGPDITLELTPGVALFIDSKATRQEKSHVPPEFEFTVASEQVLFTPGTVVPVTVDIALNGPSKVSAIKMTLIERGGQTIDVVQVVSGAKSMKPGKRAARWRFHVTMPDLPKPHPVTLLAQITCISRDNKFTTRSGPLTFIPETVFGFPHSAPRSEHYITRDSGKLRFFLRSTHRKKVRGSVEVDIPDGWTVEDDGNKEFELDENGTTDFSFDVRMGAAPKVVGRVILPVYVTIDNVRTKLFEWPAYGSPIRDWKIIGPFDNKENKQFDTVYPPEKEIDFKAEYDGASNQKVKWQNHELGYKAISKIDNLSGIDFTRLYDPNTWVCAYALVYVKSPDTRKVNFLVGSDDGIKIWLNDTMVHALDMKRAPVPDQDKVEGVTLNKGWNKVLVKITQAEWGWALYFRITNNDGVDLHDLTYSSDTQK